MSRSIEEGNFPAVLEGDAVRTYVLGATTGLARNDVGLAYVVEQRRLAVIDVSHHGDDRRPLHEILRTVRRFVCIDFFGDVSGHELDVVAEFFRYEDEGFSIEPLVDGHHKSKAHTSADDLDHRSVVHKGSEVVYGHKFGDLERLLASCSLGELLLGLEGCGFALFLAVFCTEVVLLALVHPGVGLLDLLLDLLLHFLLLRLGHSRLEAFGVFVALAFTAAGLLLRLLLIVLVLLVLLAGVAVDIRPGLGHVNLLLAYALAFLRLALELVEVNLADNLERSALALVGSLNLRLGR